MQIIGVTKPIKMFRIISKWQSSGYAYEYAETKEISGINPNDIIELTTTPRKLKKEWFGELTDEATLFFDKSATFPRYKLEGTKYKRCIKLEKADFIIVDKNMTCEASWRSYVVYEDENYVYVTDGYNTNYVAPAFKKANINPKLKYHGRVCIYHQNSALIFNTPPKPLISDEDLNKKIDSEVSPTMSADDAKQIITMLNSQDLTVVDLGIKLLAGFSMSATPFSIKTILLTNKRWLQTNARTSVGVKTMLTSLNVDRNQAESRFPWNLSYLNDSKTYSEEDLKMGRSLLKLSVENYVKNALAREIEIFEGPNLGFKVNISVEEK